MKEKFLKLQEDERRIEATIRFDVRLGQLYESLNNYGEEFKQNFEQDPTIKWNQKKCFGEHYTWFATNRKHIKNTGNKYDNKEVNRFSELKNKFLKLQEDERRLKKTIVELKNDNMSTNDDDLDDDLDADDIEQESLITMTSNVDDDQESVDLSRKRKRGALEDSLTTRRGPKPRINGYSVNSLLSDKKRIFICCNMEKQTYTKVDGQVV